MPAEQPPLGRASQFGVRRVGDTIYTPVGGNVDFSMDGSQDETEITTKDDRDDGQRDYMPTWTSYTASLSMEYLEADPGQELVWEMMFTPGMQLEFQAFYISGANKKVWTGKCFPTSVGGAAPLNEASTLDTSLRLRNVSKGRQS